MEAGVIVLLALLLVEIWGLKYQTHPNDLLSYQCTNILRGVCCFPVVFCHMNEPYNLICQMGKYAYIAVTIFFMFSSYGLEVSARTKENYLEHFFAKRVTAILVPYMLSVVIKLIFGVSLTFGGAWFVHVLLIYYFVFYFAHAKIRNAKKQEYFLLFCTLGFSIGGFFFGYKLRLPKIGLNWYPESLGLTLGILIAYHYEQFNKFFKTKVLIKFIAGMFIAVFLKYTFDNYILVFYIDKYRFLCNYLYRMAAAVSVIVVIMLLFAHIKIGNRVSSQLGKISFEIFLYHSLYLQILSKLPVSLDGNLYVSAAFLCTIMTAAIMNKAAHVIMKRMTFLQIK